MSDFEPGDPGPRSPVTRPVRSVHVGALLVALLVAAAPGCAQPRESATEPSFAELIALLSEPGGYFDTDNLISNEISYAEVIDRLAPSGGAYIGVGPEQNFSFIARLRPRWAFILDLRRDNLLHHLLLNAVLAQAAEPYDYLCWLFSRAPGRPPAPDAGIEEVLRAIDATAPDPRRFESNLAILVDYVETDLGVPLSVEDRESLRSIYQAFFDGQLEIRFRSHGRPVQLHHPTYRTLLLAKTPAGARAHFLASAASYAFVRRLAQERRLMPVVGDFAGPHALRAIGSFLRKEGVAVRAFYASNVEFYLLRAGALAAFAENVRTLPRSEEAIFIRTYFDYGRPHPAAQPGLRSTTVRQRIGRFLELFDAGGLESYWDICTADYLR